MLSINYVQLWGTMLIFYFSRVFFFFIRRKVKKKTMQLNKSMIKNLT